MNQNLEEIKNFFVECDKSKGRINCEAWVAPQAIHVPIVKDLAFTLGNIKVGAQNCCEKASGAFTGEISANSLVDMGVHFTLIGHSERRAIYKESDELLNQKTLHALETGLTVIFCVGESLDEREAGNTWNVVKSQLDLGLKDITSAQREKLMIAYEPVWAIGTGKVATPEQAQEVHAQIRGHLKEILPGESNIPLLYGGSVKPANAMELLSQADIDGALVGGASLKGDSFIELCHLAGSVVSC